MLTSLLFGLKLNAEAKPRQGWRTFIPESFQSYEYWNSQDLVDDLLSEGLNQFRCRDKHLQSVSAASHDTSVEVVYTYASNTQTLSKIEGVVNGISSCRQTFSAEFAADPNFNSPEECTIIYPSAAVECCARGEDCVSLIPASIRKSE